MSILQMYVKEVRQLIVPVGTALRVPQGHTWTLVALGVLPPFGYAPPISYVTARNPYLYGDIQVTVDDQPRPRFNALGLMDQRWGLHNLNPWFTTHVTNLQAAQQASLSTPYIKDVADAIRAVTAALADYRQSVCPLLVPVVVNSGQLLAFENVVCEDPKRIDESVLSEKILESVLDIELTITTVVAHGKLELRDWQSLSFSSMEKPVDE
jgi:hypothetical protein